MLWPTFAVRVLSLALLSQLLMCAHLLVGKLFGKTPLIKLSPKKTVEGFVGAFICTLLFGIAVSGDIALRLGSVLTGTFSGVHSG